jgi:hypothetical protein
LLKQVRQPQINLIGGRFSREISGLKSTAG